MPTEQGTDYLLIEVPGFGRDAAGNSMTSYLRLGSVYDAALVGAGGSARTPDAGATTARNGAGEDLAARVRSFRNDTRDLCNPPALDSAAHDSEASAATAPVTSADPAAIAANLHEARAAARDLRAMLDAILPDPEQWLENMVAQWRAAKAEVEEKEAAFEEKLAAFIASAPRGASPAPEVPPAYAATGYEAPKPPATEPAPYTAYVHKVDRRRETAMLHTKGGVRDHTDGNRISTTRGDKVEVVQGNYRLVVLGRRDEPCDADGDPVLPGWDLSGGHTDESSVTSVVPESSLSWTRRWNGTWFAKETTRKGDTKTQTTGDTEDHCYGHHSARSIGSEDAVAWHSPNVCPGGACRVNPIMVNRTWCEERSYYTGSALCPVPLVEDSTTAIQIVSVAHVGSASDSTTAGTMSSTTTVGRQIEATVCGTMSSTTNAGRIEDTTTCSLRTSTTKSSRVFTLTDGDTKSQTYGATTQVHVGLQTSVNFAVTTDISVGANLSVIVGGKVDVSIAGSLSASLDKSHAVSPLVHDEKNLGATHRLTLVLSVTALHVDL